MATRILTGVSSDKFRGLKAVYENETPVGTGADNRQIADVQLVQLFLRHFFIVVPAEFKKLSKPTTSRNAPTILLDGKVGRQTIDAITVFQQFAVRNLGTAEIVDGRVSVPRSVSVQGTSHVFTIFKLNFFFFNTDPENMSFNENLEDHPLVQSSCPLLVADLARRGPSS